MPPPDPSRPNPLEQLKDDIRALQERERIWPTLVQVPRDRAYDLVGMNAQRWREGSRGMLDDDEIDDILNRTTAQGPTGLTGLSFGPVKITVAARVEDDCDQLKIIQGRPMDSGEPDESREGQ
jgi:hypothetical protein